MELVPHWVCHVGFAQSRLGPSNTRPFYGAVFRNEPVTLPPLRQDDAIIPNGTRAAAERELYGALMKGFGDQEQGALEHVMMDNIKRLREDGDSYAP